MRSIDKRRRRAAAAFSTLVRLMDTLRAKHGCAWDRKQTHASLAPYLLEETYEALERIDRGDVDGLAGELGDVLLQCVFHSQIAAEAGRFEIADSVNAICQKLIRRHPHVFTANGRPLSKSAKRRSKIRTPAAVKQQWAEIKAQEKLGSLGVGELGSKGKRKHVKTEVPSGVLSGVPKQLPALLRAYEISTRAASVGFDWARPSDVVDKIDEEVRELRDALNESPERAAEELGDLLFAISNLSRKLGLEPETALRKANDKFAGRFAAMERAFEAEGRTIHQSNLEEMERKWQGVKQRGG